MDDDRRLSRHLTDSSRRGFLGVTGAAFTLAFGARLADPWTPSAPAARSADYPFQLGVASGDPLTDSVVLWTRLAAKPLEPLGGMPYARQRVDWEVAEDERFTRRVRQGSTWATPEYGHSVHVEARGLRPGREYFYRFRTGREISPVGRTKTAPEHTGLLKLAFASCASWPDGFYTAYRHLAEENPDVVFHLGDYLYEYGILADGGRRKTPVPDQFRVQCDTLDRYRIQYGLYKSDPDLQAAHQAAPWIVTWDDHEVLDNYAAEVGPGGNVSEQDFLVIRANAYRAFWENQPLRLPQRPQGPEARLYRRFRFGGLAEFNVLDGRQYRSDQLCGDGQQVGCDERLDPSRTMLGDEQERWLLDGLGRSRATWNVLAQQVAISQLDFDPAAPQRLSMDLWDGYKAARDRIFTGIVDRKVRNPVVLTGDIHYNLAGELKADFDDPDSATIGIELVGTSISSGGNGNPATGLPPGGRDAVNPHIRFSSYTRGYVSCEVTPQQWRTDFRVVPYVDRPGAPVETKATFTTLDGHPGLNTGA
ncbi:alkaline phosphatase [Microtetraspora sp. NBRC 13810]|uniref:alkaline phosphatase D family protein n=1 Tax=Microtetraspora sp. NBRC 13810 TaxID=3030990 RepID=UPI0024A4FFC3|nr:alkaline phosphatase D family protein [Microtetraspora sp. NBRC 13810]GLW12059.1 alkaline phosphatase [Microtetraspora sp. NBRC 13810]